MCLISLIALNPEDLDSCMASKQKGYRSAVLGSEGSLVLLQKAARFIPWCFTTFSIDRDMLQPEHLLVSAILTSLKFLQPPVPPVNPRFFPTPKIVYQLPPPLRRFVRDASAPPSAARRPSRSPRRSPGSPGPPRRGVRNPSAPPRPKPGVNCTHSSRVETWGMGWHGEWQLTQWTRYGHVLPGVPPSHRSRSMTPGNKTGRGARRAIRDHLDWASADVCK